MSEQCLSHITVVEIGHHIPGPLCGRVANWDDHAVNHHVFEAIRFRAPAYDQAVSALVEDGEPHEVPGGLVD